MWCCGCSDLGNSMHAYMGNFPFAMTSCYARASGEIDAKKVEGGECTYCNAACDCGLFAVAFDTAVVSRIPLL